MSDERYYEELTKLQADGLACVVCGVDYVRTAIPHVPVGRSAETSSQVFACCTCPSDVSGEE